MRDLQTTKKAIRKHDKLQITRIRFLEWHIQVSTQLQVRNLYIQPFSDFVLPARLEAFWPQPKKRAGLGGVGCTAQL